MRHASILLLAFVFLLSACAGGDDDEEFPDAQSFDDAGTPTVASDDDANETAISTTAPEQSTPAAPSSAVDVYQAGDAGEVEMRIEGDSLVLVEVRPSDGWNHTVDEEDDDEVKVDFRIDGREIDFDAELDDGRLEIDVCDMWIDPEGDVHQVGDAGEVEARINENNELELVEVRAASGWSHQVDEGDDDIEVDFRNNDRRIDFDLDLDDGRLEATTCTYLIINTAGS